MNNNDTTTPPTVDDWATAQRFYNLKVAQSATLTKLISAKANSTIMVPYLCSLFESMDKPVNVLKQAIEALSEKQASVISSLSSNTTNQTVA